VDVPTGVGIIMIKLSEEHLIPPEPRMKACTLINFRSLTSRVSEYYCLLQRIHIILILLASSNLIIILNFIVFVYSCTISILQ